MREPYLKYRVRWNGLPLAIYREIAAHLCLVEGVQTDLLPQQAQTFDYRLSQIDSLWIEHSADPIASQRVQQILAYYGDRYGAWESIEA